MDIKKIVYMRKTCRRFKDERLDDATIEKVRNAPMKPLYPEIKVEWDIVDRKEVKCACPWTTQQVISVYSEEKDGYLENVGFMFQQMDLYLQSLGLGVCWLGMGSPNPKTAQEKPGMKFIIMMAFGTPKGDQLRYDGKGFKRKPMDQISDIDDPRLEPARLSPSHMNFQPWYFVHDKDVIHLFWTGEGDLLDMGLALAPLYVMNPDTFRFFKAADHPESSKGKYFGSFTLEPLQK